ncbi:MAG: hypothetical protein K9I69_05430 [Ignavibacteriales bacterium]|nr:hypothetical protein [Ignavibacteriales bacterium]MCF8305427.1 hypothetical protein [Ignavibacteriales bacterium]MCF8316110.1 hypothetical protein [Ignavibacteriales bacterium]MCF8436612.1 hypothetical protein [Ignavibacteriales bacterium]
MNEQTIICGKCDSEIGSDSDYCPECGALFVNDVFCRRHKNDLASGVCVICGEPYCSGCLNSVNNIYLCHAHEEIEIFQGHAKIASGDNIYCRYLIGLLTENDFHPFLYNLMSSAHTPISLAGQSFNIFDVRGNNVNELKVMVPFDEFNEALKFLEELEESGEIDG